MQRETVESFRSNFSRFVMDLFLFLLNFMCSNSVFYGMHECLLFRGNDYRKCHVIGITNDPTTV